ncbi:hypothetical protein IF1G_03954 [Cordyceps javanica]|uniref:Uncharacterized protein n=1 Tax=Cordyceps javanica TaxID=43265 RepID=A0A545V4T4_9HYPO|nr:hypothetical protein IF1G_03954 [Cordyceps javanica]
MRNDVCHSPRTAERTTHPSGHPGEGCVCVRGGCRNSPSNASIFGPLSCNYQGSTPYRNLIRTVLSLGAPPRPHPPTYGMSEALLGRGGCDGGLEQRSMEGSRSAASREELSTLRNCRERATG